MALRPAPRLLAVVAAAVVAVTGLTACRSDPKIAAYVDDHRYTVAEIEAIVAEVGSIFRPDSPVSGASQTVSILVMRDVFTGYANRHNLPITPLDEAAVAARFQLPPGTRFTRIFAQYGAAQQALSAAVKPAAPSPADQEQILAHAIDGQGAPATGDLRQYLTEEGVGTQVGFRNLIAAAVSEARVAVNPRYDVAPYPVTMQLGQEAQSRLEVPIQASGPVTDLGDPAA